MSYFSSDVTPDWRSEWSVDGLEFGINEGTKLGLRDGILLGKKIGDIDGITVGTYNSSDLGCLEDFTNIRTDSNIEGLLLGVWLGSVNVLEIVLKEGTELDSVMRLVDMMVYI